MPALNKKNRKYEWHIFTAVLFGVGITLWFMRNYLSDVYLAIISIGLPGIVAFLLQSMFNRNVGFPFWKYIDLKYLFIALMPFLGSCIILSLFFNADAHLKFANSIGQISLFFVAVVCAEFAWRSYLQNVLVNRFNFLPGVVLVGITWGFWNLFTEFLTSGPDSVNGFTVIMTFVQLIAISIFSGYIRRRSQSLIIVSLIHFSWIILRFFPGGQFCSNCHELPFYIFQTAIWVFSAEIVIWRLLKSKKHNSKLTHN
ncbi:MAG: CPBP family intramembrane metalloprotease [Calditrichaeota bacterium]|nr:CPBP family intramembrane metalloprotease [Calditrichota bacterium]